MKDSIRTFVALPRPSLTSEISPGLLMLQGNRFELLCNAVLGWLDQRPLAPLEEEVFLVQSNGVAEWLKMALARHGGVCAAVKVELPARFLWRSFRQVLGATEVPAQSAFDRGALAWRLMALLPECLSQKGFEPLSRFLADGDAIRRLQLCRRLADLFDQYQVYRSDWLDDWAAGRDVVAPSSGAAQPVPPDQQWQPLLWRELLASLDDAARLALRPALHRRFAEALEADAAICKPVARRVVVFGMSHLPLQTLTALMALSRRSQVLLAVPNPCQFHWTDQLSAHAPSAGTAGLAGLESEDRLHLDVHPLLTAWGRQSGDFLRQLDAYEEFQVALGREAPKRLDLFDEEDGPSLLCQVQSRIREMSPLAEHPGTPPDADDRSIVFHIAHGIQREVEVLHDQLLTLLANSPGGRPLRPRDIVVMMPDVESFAPAIRAVFGQHARGDARYIPFDVADTRDRVADPVVAVLDWLLRMPSQRCRLTEIRDLLDVPGVAKRFGLPDADLPRLSQWMSEAGVRWGLHEDQRGDLGLQSCGEQNTWLFGLRRMLLGYASGDARDGEGPGAFEGIEPYTEVAGLDAELAGSLAWLVERLIDWWRTSSSCLTPVHWADAARGLLDGFIDPVDDAERYSVSALRDALQCWLEACECAGFDEPVTLPVFREAWLSELDETGLGRRFLSGGVTFCTLLPMRSIPFEVVCVLGMNDGDFPRSSHRGDFDLMAVPGLSRPGDRSRRGDDRQLMLEALLSARRVFYVSWSGRHVRDNSELPPSVLVSQLRDYLSAGWTPEVLHQRTTEHPLQPFSRRYFTAGSGLFTHAREWRQAHRDARVPPEAEGVSPDAPPEPDAGEPGVIVTIERLTAFLKNPVKDFFRHQLGVVFDGLDEAPTDDESFELSGLEAHGLVRDLIDGFDALGPQADVPARLQSRLAHLRAAGRLPMAAMGERCSEWLATQVSPMLQSWQGAQRRHGEAQPAQLLRFQHQGVVVEDVLAVWRQSTATGQALAWRDLLPGRVLLGKDTLRASSLVGAWVRTLASSACGLEVHGVLVARDAQILIPPMRSEQATSGLVALLEAFQAGAAAPLPVACATALAWLSGGEEAAEKVYQGQGAHLSGEGQEECLARLYPDFAALAADGRFAHWVGRLFEPMRVWMAECIEVTPHAGEQEISDEF